jgi:enolase
MRVNSIGVRVIYDSLGGPTLEAEVNGHAAACPAGTSTSKYEAPIAPIPRALRTFAAIKRELLKEHSQGTFDSVLKRSGARLGSQASTALSTAFFAASNPRPLSAFPNLLANVLGGGSHSPKGAPSMQEILVFPEKAKSLPQALEIVFAVWKEIGEALGKKRFAALNYEAAWTAAIDDEKALELVSGVAKSYKALLGVDMAASQYYKKGLYDFGGGYVCKPEEELDCMLAWAKDYRLAYLEDPLQQDDFDGFAELTAKLKGKTLVSGDDLISTNISRFGIAVEKGSVSSVIIKPNQAGTVTESLQVLRFAKSRGIVPVVSHRSRETPDTSLCRLAQLAPLAKLGAAGIRTVKLNGLLRLWQASEKPRLSKAWFK